MMIDVDAISRRFGHLVALHIHTTALLSAEDRSRHPAAYSSNLADRAKSADCGPENIASDLSIQVLTSSPLNGTLSPPSVETTEVDPTIYPLIFSVPVLIYSAIPHIRNQYITSTPCIKTYNKVPCLSGNVSVDWLCINEITGSFLSWYKLVNCGSISWTYLNIFTGKLTSTLFKLPFPKENIIITNNVVSSMNGPRFNMMNISGLDSMSTPYL